MDPTGKGLSKNLDRRLGRPELGVWVALPARRSRKYSREIEIGSGFSVEIEFGLGCGATGTSVRLLFWYPVDEPLLFLDEALECFLPGSTEIHPFGER
jgi:hypothetical protein